MPNLQQYPWNLNLIKNVEDNVVFLTRKLVFFQIVSIHCFFWARIEMPKSLSQRNSIFSFSLAQLLSWKKEHRSIAPDRYTSHAQWYQFFTQMAVRTGLLWKIPPNGALRLSTPYYTLAVQLWISVILNKMERL